MLMIWSSLNRRLCTTPPHISTGLISGGRSLVLSQEVVLHIPAETEAIRGSHSHVARFAGEGRHDPPGVKGAIQQPNSTTRSQS